MMSTTRTDVIIIGGGAAGCVAAVSLALGGINGEQILLLEHNHRLMHKLSITGKGRCNLTNNADNDTILKNLPTNGRFMHSALSAFSAADCMSFFEELGVRLKTERGGRVFPLSDKAGEVTGALSEKLRELGVRVVYDKAVRICTEAGIVTGVDCEKATYRSPKIIIATGGLSYPKTGSTGDGYRMAAELGHSIIEPKPALVPIVTEEDCSGMAGLSLKNVTLSLFDKAAKKSHRPVFSQLGELLFTHFGVSGPLVLSASSYMRSGRYVLSIDLKPGLDEQALDARILRDIAEEQNRKAQNALRRLLPESLILPVLERAGIPPDTQMNSVTREQRRGLVAVLKGFTLTAQGLRPIEEAVITDGGVAVREIDPRSMQSKLVEGLYFAGEVIDVAGFTGGFNLQTAFSTAVLAARDILSERN